MNQTKIERLRELNQARTSGPWEWHGIHPDEMIVGIWDIIVADPVEFNPQDRTFIVALVNATDDLLAVAGAAVEVVAEERDAYPGQPDSDSVGRLAAALARLEESAE